MKLYELSIKKPVAVIMAVCVAVLLGLYSMTMLDTEMMPDITMPYAIVYTGYNGVAPSEIETLVTKPMENAVSSVSGVKSIQSRSSEGTSLVIVEFNSGTDIDVAAQDLRDKIDMYKMMLPDDCDNPTIMKLDMNSMPVAMFSFSINGQDLTKTKKYVDDNLSKTLESIDGVGSVNVSGGNEREIQVVMDTNKMFGYNIGISQLVSAISTENNDIPGGSVSGMGKDLSIRTVGKFSSLKDIENVPITTTTGEIVFLRDVAKVVDGTTEDSTYARLNGSESLSISIQKQSGANTVDVVKNVTKVLDNLKAANPNVDYEMTMEQASYIENSISSVASSAVIGAILAIIILFLFLGSFRSALVIGISMPVSIFTTFIGMYFSGMSLNVVSLGGLALGVGMLVDNSVVVLENIYRRRSELYEKATTAGIKGSAEVVGAVIASVLTTCIVYVPLIFVKNMMAEMFNQLSFAIIFSQISSLIVTFLLVPMLSSRIDELETHNKVKDIFIVPFDKFLKLVYKGYEKLLRFALGHRKTIIGIVLGCFVLSIVALGLIGMEMMPSSDEGSFTVSIETPAGSTLDTTDEIAKQAEDIITKNEYVQSVFCTVGSGGTFSSGASNSASITVTLVDKDKRGKLSTNDVLELVRQDLNHITGADFSLSASSSTGMSSSGDATFTIYGDDFDALESYADSAVDILKGINGTREVTTSLSETKPEARIYVDREKASRYGLTTSAAASLIKTSISGQVASEFADAGKEYDIRVMLPENQTETYENLKNLKIKSGTGQWITLADVASLKIEQGYTTIQRQDQQRIVDVTCKLYGVDIGTVTNEFNEKFAQVPVPDGCTYETGGTYESMMDAMVDLAMAIVLGIVLMYMIMAAQFGSYVEPLLVLFSVPLALIGVVLSLVIDGNPLNVISVIGMLMLSGMIVNNAIVLLDFINVSKAEGTFTDKTELIVNAGKTRLRPVLMTTITSILGFLPMVLSTSDGSEMMRPLAVVLLGGLAVGTVLTLVFIPTIYYIADGMLEKHKAKKAERKAKKAAKKAAQA